MEYAFRHADRLVHLPERPGILGDRGRDAAHAGGPAIELLDDGSQDARIHIVQAKLIHVQQLQRIVGHGVRDVAFGPHLCIVPYSPQQAIRNARRPS